MGSAIRPYRLGEVGPKLVRAAEYLRMSTEHQRYSTENQKDAIRAYAARHGIFLVKTYTDGGRSGLTLRGRPGLQRLLGDVLAGTAGFDVILVYDVSRWGRFQDTDESATYEFMCRRAGIELIYCEEPFPEADAPLTAILKSIKRSMAGEFSRDLGEKCYRGHRRLASMGYHQGGLPPYGLRRARIDEGGRQRRQMRRGQSKVLSTDQVILVPGPAHEQKTVRDIFRQFADLHRSTSEIAAGLNARGIEGPSGVGWSKQNINRILHNERYAGTLTWNCTTERLKTERRRTDPKLWVRAEGAIVPVISRDLWGRSQERFDFLVHGPSKEELLRQLKAALDKRGRLSSKLIDIDEDLPSSNVYRRRFGSLRHVYAAIGYKPETVPLWRDSYYRNVAARKRVKGELCRHLHARGHSIETWIGLIAIDHSVRIAIVSAFAQRARSGHPRWVMHRRGYEEADLFLAIRMAENEDQILGYYLLPRSLLSAAQTSLGTRRSAPLEAYRAGTLQEVLDLLDWSLAARKPFFSCLAGWAAQNGRRLASNDLASAADTRSEGSDEQRR